MGSSKVLAAAARGVCPRGISSQWWSAGRPECGADTGGIGKVVRACCGIGAIRSGR